MPYNGLFVLVEGDSDLRFFQNLLVPRFQDNYANVHIWPYAQQKDEKVRSFLRSIRCMEADYLYVVDLDDAPCITAKKESATRRFPLLSEERIIVVVREIEGWYYAGVNREAAERLGVPYERATDALTKEHFQGLIAAGYDSRIDFQLEVLKTYCVEEARESNSSFSYFMRRFIRSD